MIVTTNGRVPVSCGGTSMLPLCCSCEATALMNPKKMAMTNARSGRQAPMIMIARARKPRPATMLRSNELEASIDR